MGPREINLFTGDTAHFPVSLYTLWTISELPDMDYVTFMTLTRNWTFSLGGELNASESLQLLAEPCSSIISGLDLSCWMAHATPKVMRTECSNPRSCLTSKVMGWHFSRTAYSLFQTVSHMTSRYQMQSVPCPGRDIPSCTTSSPGRNLTDHQIKSRDLPPQTCVQLCLSVEEIWDDTQQAQMTQLNPAIPWRCRVMHEAQFLSHPVRFYVTALNGVLHRTKWLNTFFLANYDSQQIANSAHSVPILWGSFHTLNFPFKFMCVQYTKIAIYNFDHPGRFWSYSMAL